VKKGLDPIPQLNRFAATKFSTMIETKFALSDCTCGKLTSLWRGHQGDQIGRIFANRVIAHSEKSYLKITEEAHYFFPLCG
jgi:hypothetical protein